MYLPEPFNLYPACGKPVEPPPANPDPGAGLFHLPVKLPNGARMMIAVNDAGEYVAGALIEAGGDLERARWELSVAAGLVGQG